MRAKFATQALALIAIVVMACGVMAPRPASADDAPTPTWRPTPTTYGSPIITSTSTPEPTQEQPATPTPPTSPLDAACSDVTISNFEQEQSPLLLAAMALMTVLALSLAALVAWALWRLRR